MGYQPLSLDPSAAPAVRRPSRFRLSLLLAGLFAGAFFYTCGSSPSAWPVGDDTTAGGDSLCPQAMPKVPGVRPDITDKNYEGHLKNVEWRSAAAERLAAAVRINTETFDYLRDLPPPEKGDDVEDRKGLTEFRLWLEKTYPLVHKHLHLDVVNRYALLYRWQGTDEASKPLVLCSHMDTVPVPKSSLDQWIYPPFSGKIDGEYIWGRGSVDTKNTLVAIVEAAELLLSQDFKPERTVIFAFGYDEEISGYNGAKYLADALFALGLKDNVELLVDEGPGIAEELGSTFASVGVSEKGYTDITLTVSAQGGHSSIPPKHTGIGLLAKMITELEDNPFSPELVDENPFLGSLQCAAEHAKDMNPWLRAAIKNIGVVRKPLVKYLSKDPQMRYMMQTSQAVDMINGGVKLNALPEFVSAEINHRIAPQDSVASTEAHIVKTLLPVAKSHGLNFTFVDASNSSIVHNADANAVASMKIITYRGALEPAPVSPKSGRVWDMLAGTVRRVAEDTWELKDKEKKSDEDDGEPKDKTVVVVPMLMPANTDTRHYWPLTRHIYRYDPIRSDKSFGIHTVNERIPISDFIGSIAFFHELIRNFQELVQQAEFGGIPDPHHPSVV
ncbi:hypothetical protein HDU87_005793 [Geranomyces variabilis]|uniref:Peptidase M20 dimerisation domain-containing protein n=1 Tax=Geranomyces variabilis TaxID=109894 RepID=A0AAD5TLU6_9FUNG|nr:hypothetical protein HDU87_005793 [Geranomyces variabilis]